ncbi:iron-containing redox enzyme family protein [Halobacteriovorax sp. GB3]|uniref:iron-containing redox enzyme family protein n=1 Tax=Halobacteriovorax sp. GB3 TaxID=2719615 RepID=UPI00235E2ED2|nr:iron-containing redox enzyme family protein [Halobacteriovorax sp. GB3]MDD0852872.1 iron-containing redox enzyme family protein [Halobacteriovorax sp. GB3]
MENSMFNKIYSHWEEVMKEVNTSKGFSRILNKEITSIHYACILEQIFHHTRENPQIQTFATAFFRGHQRTQIKPFYRHAISEIGHDQLALNDMKALGFETEHIPSSRPSNSTTALLSYAFYQIQFRNPVGYLGYLFHLEYMPTHFGKDYMEALEKVGVSKEAMSFIFDHHTIDQGHIKMMQGYIRELVQTTDDLEEVKYAIEVTAKLYSDMVSDAIAKGDVLFEQAMNQKKESFAMERGSLQ